MKKDTIHRFFSLFLVLAAMVLFLKTDIFGYNITDSPSITLGFLLLSAYCIGYVFEKHNLPGITGYVFAGLVFGPYVLKLYSHDTIINLKFINSLALAFIAFCAGGELKISDINKNKKSIVFLIIGITVIVFTGVTFSVFIISGFISFMKGLPDSEKLAVSAIFGVIAVARSPSSTIAIISETKAKGDYTNTVLSVTIATDIIIIVMFALVLSLCQIMIFSNAPSDSSFIVHLITEIIISFVVGFFLGKSIIFLITRLKIEFPVVITAMGFVVIKFCHLLGIYFKDVYDISINIEPLLICMAAGFTVQNFSSHGNLFLKRLDKVSLSIYIAFFAIMGASINVQILKENWFLGLFIVISRTAMIFVGSYISGKLSGDPPRIYKYTWLGFITQAGVSLGLLTEVVRRFPEMGTSIQSILIASIALNQLIGPIALKYGLNKTGETNLKVKRLENAYN